MLLHAPGDTSACLIGRLSCMCCKAKAFDEAGPHFEVAGSQQEW